MNRNKMVQVASVAVAAVAAVGAGLGIAELNPGALSGGLASYAVVASSRAVAQPMQTSAGNREAAGPKRTHRIARHGAPSPAAVVPVLIAPSATKASQKKPTGLAVHVTLTSTTVRLRERIRVDYSWSDGAGQLVDTNHVGTMAEKVLRDVPCTSPAGAPQTSSGHGSWFYTPVLAFVGPMNPTARVFVGLNVRTGGCAPVEDRTAGQWVTVLPTDSPSPQPSPDSPSPTPSVAVIDESGLLPTASPTAFVQVQFSTTPRNRAFRPAAVRS